MGQNALHASEAPHTAAGVVGVAPAVRRIQACPAFVVTPLVVIGIALFLMGLIIVNVKAHDGGGLLHAVARTRWGKLNHFGWIRVSIEAILSGFTMAAYVAHASLYWFVVDAEGISLLRLRRRMWLLPWAEYRGWANERGTDHVGTPGSSASVLRLGREAILHLCTVHGTSRRLRLPPETASQLLAALQEWKPEQAAALPDISYSKRVNRSVGTMLLVLALLMVVAAAGYAWRGYPEWPLLVSAAVVAALGVGLRKRGGAGPAAHG